MAGGVAGALPCLPGVAAVEGPDAALGVSPRGTPARHGKWGLYSLMVREHATWKLSADIYCRIVVHLLLLRATVRVAALPTVAVMSGCRVILSSDRLLLLFATSILASVPSLVQHHLKGDSVRNTCMADPRQVWSAPYQDCSCQGCARIAMRLQRTTACSILHVIVSNKVGSWSRINNARQAGRARRDCGTAQDWGLRGYLNLALGSYPEPQHPKWVATEALGLSNLSIMTHYAASRARPYGRHPE